MARPKVPLISKRAALEAALDIIDTEGIDALSIRRLADRLGVNGASLYHHFQNKDEIVVGAAKLALEEVRVPQGHEEPWQVWLLRNARRLRAAFRDHPDLVPVMLRREPLGIGTSQLEQTFAMLAEEGVPLGAIAPMMEALELYAIGSALHESAAGSTKPDRKRAPHMAEADAARALTPDEIFDLVCEQIVATTVAVATEKSGAKPNSQKKPPAKRTRRSA
ncbi:TetR/AcrR family transcriptional regulator [Sporichthya polymorpha]|uniref:TetR/AcrR family transcriptional regulator n=1 Tax=Sporichthya polymorpha TaxID=35751 RepID=UPI0003630102|nr:TetR family transcriptional regulator [Sporichthya polymorpha]